MSNNSNNVLLGILAGTAIGATLGILFAPDKGTKTRQKIADQANATKDTFLTEADHFKEKIVNISEIVYSIGLTSRSYFSKIFKEKYNCSPKYYQEHQNALAVTA